MRATTKLFGDEGGAILGQSQFQILLFANVVSVFGTALVSPLLSSLIGPFDVTPSSIGLMISLFSGPGIIVIPIAGFLADNVGRKPVIITGLLIYGIAVGAIAFTSNFEIALALRVVQGVGYAGVVPIVITTLGDIYAGTQEAAAQGLRFTTSGLSLTVVPLLAGVLVAFSWRYPFLLFLVSIPVSLLVWFVLDEPEPTNRDADVTPAKGMSRKVEFQQLLALSRSPELLSIIVARSLAAITLIGFFTYVSIIVVNIAGGTPTQASYAVAVNSLVFAAAASQVGRLSARLTLGTLLIAGTTALGLGLSLVGLGAGLVTILVGSAILGLGVGVTLTIHRSLVTSFAPDDYRGSIVSLTEMAGRFANFFTPVGMGWIIGITTPFIGIETAVRWTTVGIGAFGSLGGFICLFIWVTHRDAIDGTGK